MNNGKCQKDPPAMECDEVDMPLCERPLDLCMFATLTCKDNAWICEEATKTCEDGQFCK